MLVYSYDNNLPENNVVEQNYFKSKLTNQKQSDAATEQRVIELSALARSNDATIKMLMDKLGQYEDEASVCIQLKNVVVN